MRTDKRTSQKADKKAPSRVHKRGVVGYSKKSALLEEAITHMNTGKYGRSSAALKELLALDPHNTEARRLFATLHLRLGSLVTARQAFESLANEAIGRQDYWLAESLLREYLAAGPRCVPFLELLAHVYQEKGDEMAAVGELGKAIEILRDDPDSENPQKAAQLYAKIREVAPASPIAFQLAPLFDVQTGDFLVRPAGSPPASAANEPDPQSHDSAAATAAEQPLPEVMPWEVTDESPPGASSPSLAATFVDAPDLSPNEAQDDGSAMESQGFQSTTQQDRSSDSLSPPTEVSSDEIGLSHPLGSLPSSGVATILEVDEPNAQELSSEVASESQPESEPGSANDIPSSMPWEQETDASIQISEPETPPITDPYSSLESILASMRIQDGLAASPVETEETPTRTVDLTEPALPLESMEPARIDSATTLSSPMPWEQVSDAGMQIPEAESPAISNEEPLSSSPLAANPASIGLPDPISAPTRLDQSSETDSAAAETSRPTSFSWNSVFDKAWKLAAGTMAPSPTGPSEHGRELSSETQNTAMPADSLAAQLSTLNTPPSFPDISPAPLTPAIPASFSVVVEEQTIPEVGRPPKEPLGLGGSPERPSPEPLPPQPLSVSPTAVEATPPETAPTTGVSSHWNTGEVAVQVHRPSQKKKRWDKEAEEVEQTPAIPAPALETLSETLSEAIREWRSTPVEPASPAIAEEVPPPQADARPDWMQASDAITFNVPLSPSPTTTSARHSDVVLPREDAEPAHSVSASAVEVLFAQSRTDDYTGTRDLPSWSTPRPRFIARLHRIRIGISSFIGFCFSTSRSLTFLAVMLAITTMVVAAAGVAAIGAAWMAMEDPPTSLYQKLTITPPRSVTDSKKNGYLLLLGFDAPVGQDPVQAGYERKADEQNIEAAQVCMSGDNVKDGSDSAGASAHLVKGWFRNGDPVAQMKGQGETIRSMVTRESTALTRYQRWLTMPFDDWGYGQLLSPNCAHVLLVHRLFLLEGFNQDFTTGLDRLEADLQSWRTALGQSRTLMMKMLAVTAVQDDASLASGLLSRMDLDGSAVTRLSKLVRPLDQVELSVRWPMQSHFAWATKAVPADLKQDKSHERPWLASMVAAMPLPVQRRANAYAEYYEAANKAVASGRFTNLPKVTAFVRTPPTGVTDYLTNPVEHLVGIEPLPSWDPYVMRMIEADAQLRLVGLQAWIRRGPQEEDVLTRLAKAGQAYYDPFTGLPMLVNQRKGLIYSVGRDGKDQEGDRLRDVAVAIPSVPFSSPELRRAGASSPSR